MGLPSHIGSNTSTTQMSKILQNAMKIWPELFGNVKSRIANR